jgi:RNA polymerase sigma factor (sigma-70 family)
MANADYEALFRQVVDNHMGILLKTAHGFAVGAADRDDLVQEMLLAAWQALPAYNGQCKLSTFLYRVAHNRALNWQRSRLRYDRKLLHFSEAPHLTLNTGDSDPETKKLEWLYAVIRQLPPLDRTLIMLQLDQLPQREIAEVTGLTETNVGVRLHRIKQTLARQKPQNSHEL